MSTKRLDEMKRCKYCDGQLAKLFLTCCVCDEFVHLKCCSRPGTPGSLLGDVFFIYTCHDCNSGKERFVRAKMTWVDVVLLVLYNLAVKHGGAAIGNGYFHRDKQIKKFLNSNWDLIFPHMKSRRKSWRQMLYETLKKNPQYFKNHSADANNKLPIWYKLAKPGMLPNQAMYDRQYKKVRGKQAKEVITSETETSTGYDSSSQDVDANVSLEGSSIVESQLNTISLNPDNNMYSRSYVKPSASLSEFLFAGEEESCALADEEIDIEAVDIDMAVDINGDESLPIALNIEDVEMECELGSTLPNESITVEREEIMENSCSPVSLPCLLQRNPTSNTLPWHPSQTPATQNKCKPMSLGEEAYELHKLSKRVQSSELMSVAELRLHRKLVVRKIRRERGLPVLDVDAYSREGGTSAARETAAPFSRVLDRYQRRIITAQVDDTQHSFWTRLMGHTEQYSCFTSPMTKRVLKAFIRQDFESQPLWLRLCSEIRSRGGCVKEPPSPIIYSYVRPHHIPAVNCLAEQYFWPGINLSECLHYPDYSCVVLYKKLVVGFAFLVPDVGYNEAYISFIFTRPEWRNAGIGTFMLYHLIQTCMGKDVTLHVSATNPALLLYQKFGFKVEEFIQDFYDKYLPVESNDCRHALFLRLSR